MHWVIQDIFGEETTELVKDLNSFQIVKDIPKNKYNTPVLFRGSVEFVEECSKIHNVHGINKDNYECFRYYPKLHNSLLNSDYIILPWGSLKDSFKTINKTFDTDYLFIRPSSGAKIFTGTTLQKRWWNKELDIIREINPKIKEDTLVVISSKKLILSEYRAVMFRNQFLDAVLYEGIEQSKYKEVIYSIVEDLTYFPDDVYTIDLAWTPSGVFVLELNSFNCAGLYGMRVGHMVDSILNAKLSNTNLVDKIRKLCEDLSINRIGEDHRSSDYCVYCNQEYGNVKWHKELSHYEDCPTKLSREILEELDNLSDLKKE